MQIDDMHIAEAEHLLIGNNHFDQERLKFIRSLDSCDLLAVPGSGKTTALQAKLYCLSRLRPYSAINGILVLSHTNAAVDEIKKKLSKVCPNLFEYPNFVGTIQDFVDSYLAIPYYNTRHSNPISRIDTAICKEEFLKAFQNKWIRNDKVWSWYKYNGIEQAKNFGIKATTDGHLIPWNYTIQKEFKVASTKIPKTWKGYEEKNRKHILKILCELKIHMLDRGILSYDDCYVLAQLYINRCPRIKSILRKRFKYVFIDETQDLQEHQLEIMDQLFCDDSVCFQRIDDVNQSIFHVGSDSTDCAWEPRSVQTFNNSMRLTSPVASIVDAFMFRRELGQAVRGTRNTNPVIKPYLLVYDYEHRDLLMEKFEELIETYDLNNIPEKKYGFHIIGWNSKWPDDREFNPKELRLMDLYPEYVSEEYSTKYAESIADYVDKMRNLSDNKERMSIINEIMCECLRLNNKNDLCDRPFTPTSLLNFLKSEDNNLFKNYKLLAFAIVKLMVLSQYQEVYDKIQNLAEWLLEQMGVTKSDEYASFISEPYIPNTENPQQEHSRLQIETVHHAKGQTHCATLYIETMYQGKYESIHVNKEKKKATKTKAAVYYPNPFYKETGEQQKGAYIQSAMKMTYVGLSRPTHLLCYAMHKSSYELYDVEKLKNSGWQIIDLT